jgi:hypothetical protein
VAAFGNGSWVVAAGQRIVAWDLRTE